MGRDLTLAVLEHVKGIVSWSEGRLVQAGEYFGNAACAIHNTISQASLLAEQDYFGDWLSGDRYVDLKGMRDKLESYENRLRMDGC